MEICCEYSADAFRDVTDSQINEHVLKCIGEIEIISFLCLKNAFSLYV